MQGGGASRLFCKLASVTKAAQKLSTTDWAVLALLAEGGTHGFRLAAVFSAEGELASIWKIQRPQVYRALEHLVKQDLAQPIRQEAGEAGPTRILYALRPKGHKAVMEWLYTPVTRLRFGRSDLRLKIAFLLRQKRDLKPLLEAQQEVYISILKTLEKQIAQAATIERVSVLWRLEMARASLRFVEQLLTQNT